MVNGSLFPWEGLMGSCPKRKEKRNERKKEREKIKKERDTKRGKERKGEMKCNLEVNQSPRFGKSRVSEATKRQKDSWK